MVGTAEGDRIPQISNQVRAGESVRAVILAGGLGMRLRP
jgi:hypothetical protein